MSWLDVLMWTVVGVACWLVLAFGVALTISLLRAVLRGGKR